MRLSYVNNIMVDPHWFTGKMNDNTLIRFENLRALGKTPGELATATGLSKQYWSNMLRGNKSFGESAARNLEEKLELPRLFLDEDHTAMSKDIAKVNVNVEGCRESPEEVSGGMGENESALCQPIPTSMTYSAPNLKSCILLMGSLVGALDRRSRRLIGELLKDLAEEPDDAEDIANKASGLATIQKPISKNKDLNKGMRGRKESVETKPAPLEH
jgi:hypothetical protein